MPDRRLWYERRFRYMAGRVLQSRSLDRYDEVIDREFNTFFICSSLNISQTCLAKASGLSYAAGDSTISQEKYHQPVKLDIRL